MALSDVYFLSMTFEDIRNEVLERLQIIGDGETITTAMTAKVKTSTNMLVKEWEAQGIHLWTYTEATLFLVTGQAKYDFTDTDTRLANGFIETSLTADQVATDVILALADTTGMAAPTDILATDPTITTLDWTAINTTLSADSITGLTITQVGGVTNSGADFDLVTTVGTTYQLDVLYTEVSNISADILVFDTLGTLDTQNPTATGTVTLTFTARETTTTFRAINRSSLADGQEFQVFMLNYMDQASGDRIGIEMDDTTRFWDTILTVDSSTQVTINNGLPSSASSGLSVYSYKEGFIPVRRILNVRRRESTDYEIPINFESREDYFNLPNKTQMGLPIQAYYSRQEPQGIM